MPWNCDKAIGKTDAEDMKTMAENNGAKAKPLIKRFTAPLVYRGLPAKTAVMLGVSGIAFEPKGSAPYEIFAALSGRKGGKTIRKLIKKLEPWQKKRIGEILHENTRRGRILRKRQEKTGKRHMGREDKLPISTISMTEKCNRGCPHCGVLANMGLPTMPFSDFERYLGLIDIKKHLTFSGAGEQFLYSSRGKNLGDAVAMVLERFQGIHMGIVTSGISFSDKDSAEMKAAERLAGISEVDKSRIYITISIRSFMRQRMEDAKRTLKYHAAP
jgi:hypothetical protein